MLLVFYAIQLLFYTLIVISIYLNHKTVAYAFVFITIYVDIHKVRAIFENCNI